MFVGKEHLLAEPASGDADDLRAAFEDFQRAQRETLALMETRDPFNDPQMQAEAYRGLLYTIVGSIKAAGLAEHDFPRFMRAVDWTSKAGLDNPDNNYYFAMLRDDADYRIRGTRGTTRNLIFQLVVGQPGVRGAGSSTNISVFDADDLEIATDGSFELIVSRDDPGPGYNWMPSGEGAEALLVRFTHSDWANEREGTLTIERIGAEGEQRPLLTPSRMAAHLREVAVHMYDRTATWMDFADKAWLLRARNSITAARPSRGGLVGQYSAFGNWELADDQALILRTFPSSGSYQGIELGNRWFVSLDYETRTSSMTLDQAHRASDGSYCDETETDEGWREQFDRLAARTGKRKAIVAIAPWNGTPLRDGTRPAEVVGKDDYFVSRNLYPNVDFYSGIVYRAMGIPTNMFTVMFALGRLPGWISHWTEGWRQEGRIHRPRQIYVGPAKRDYVPLHQR